MQRLFRMSFSLPFAALITASLAVFMAYMISVEGEPGPEIAELTVDLFPQVDLIDPPGRVELQPVLPVDPPPPPPAIEAEAAQLPGTDFTMIALTLPPVSVEGMGDGDVNFNRSNADPQPIVRIPPAYPMRENERGVEGSCVLQFDVTAGGSPVNIRVLQCDSSGFARESVRAVERWRYNPRVRDGEPQMYHGLQTRLDFNLND